MVVALFVVLNLTHFLYIKKTTHVQAFGFYDVDLNHHKLKRSFCDSKAIIYSHLSKK